jgi:hypothetical protein
VWSGRGLCDELITRPEEFYRLWHFVVCDQETSWYQETIIVRVGLQSQREGERERERENRKLLRKWGYVKHPAKIK